MAEAPGKPSELALVRGPQTAVVIPRQPVNFEQIPSALNAKNALFAIFKHKWLIVVCALLGVVAAILFYLFYPPLYESQAKLLVRYVVERSAVDSVDANTGASSRTSDSVIGAEVEILTSWDLAMQAAEVIGPSRLLPGHRGAVTMEEAAASISRGLEVTFRPGSNIIFVSYKNRDPQLATMVLDQLIKKYFNKHLEVHRSAGAFDFVSQQIDAVRARLNRTEDALIPLKAKIGVVSLSDSKAALSADLARTEAELHDAEAELAGQQASVKEIEQAKTDSSADAGDRTTPATKSLPATSPPAKIVASPAPADQPPQASYQEVQRYELLIDRLAQMRSAEVEMLSKYSPNNEQVKRHRELLAEAQRDKKEMERKFPDLPSRLPAGTSGRAQGPDLAAERARLAGMQAKTASLRQTLADIQGRIKRLSEAGPELAELERQKDLQESSYKYFEGTLEKARVDEALDPTKIPNISAVQKASPPTPVTKTRNKIALGLAAGGLGLGLALALLRGLLLDQSFKRPIEVEERLGTALLLSIPYAPSASLTLAPDSPAAPKLPAGGSGQRQVAPWDTDHFIRPYCEAIRDRLGLYFELHHLTHKPKLVGVTSFSKGGGTSTLAAGLAAALSETDDGKVLLVDASLGPEEVHPFFQGRPAYSLTAALTGKSSIDAASENLYLARVSTIAGGPAQLGLKRFFDLMPNLKASDFDYIIFDLPWLNETSSSWGMAAFMDKLLVIVEGENNHRAQVSRGYRRLASERDNVSFVFNKARSYVPRLLDGEI